MTLLLATLTLHLAGAAPAGPLRVSLEVSDEAVAKLSLARDVVEARLRDEGFVLVAPDAAQVRLTVRLLGAALELVAEAGAAPLVRHPERTDAWRTEASYELAQRLSVLAREARRVDVSASDAGVPAGDGSAPPTTGGTDTQQDTPPANGGTNAPRDAPAAGGTDTQQHTPPGRAPDDAAARAADDAMADTAPARRSALPIAFLARGGLATRFSSVDPFGQLAGLWRRPGLQPLAGVGFTWTDGAGGSATELPVVLGVRWPHLVGATTLAAEAHAGLRLHLFSGVGDTTVRVDPLAQLAVTAERPLGDTLSLGAALGLSVSSARMHLRGGQVLWRAGPVGAWLTLQLGFDTVLR